jgi:cell wall-associated NlpC family hydrolase
VQEGLPVHAVRSHRRPTQSKIRVGWALGTLIGVLTAGAVVTPVAYAATTTKTTLGPSRTIDAGAKAYLNGRVTSGSSPVKYAKVTLQQSVGNGWKYKTTAKAHSSGKVMFRVTPTRTTYYRLVFQGRGTLSSSVSGQVRMQVITDRGKAVVRTAASQAGKPYRYGAAGPNAFDCSGFTQFVFKKYGKSLPHSATQQARYGKSVSKSAVKPGDLLLFGGGGRYTHAAIYAGGNQMWDASTSGKPVAKKKIWSNKYVVRRLV